MGLSIPRVRGIQRKIGPIRVTTGNFGIHFYRNHRDPVIHLVIWRRFFALATSTSVLRASHTQAETGNSVFLPVEGRLRRLVASGLVQPNSLRDEGVKPLHGLSHENNAEPACQELTRRIEDPYEPDRLKNRRGTRSTRDPAPGGGGGTGSRIGRW